VTQIFGGTQGQDDTNAILADGKNGIGNPMDWVTNANLAVKSFWYWVPAGNSKNRIVSSSAAFGHQISQA